MTTRTTSAFDLPERLDAKADPTLIAGDEEHFAAIVDIVIWTSQDDRMSLARKSLNRWLDSEVGDRIPVEGFEAVEIRR